MKAINVYLNFDGNCREAMEFYKKALGGELNLMPFEQGQGKFDFPEAAKNRIMHARLSKGDAILMASDTMPGHPMKNGNNFSVSVAPESLAETEKIFSALSEGGKVTMPLQDTFWGARFGMLTDRFGINWMLNFER